MAFVGGTGGTDRGRSMAPASPELYQDPRWQSSFGGTAISAQALANATNSEFTNVYGSVGRRPHNDLRETGNRSEAPTYYIAEWKGYEFYVDTSADEFGRRGDIYEYPLSDYIGYKDLGKKADRFKLEGYLLGSNQLEQAQVMRLRGIDPEPAMLSHPLFGQMRVACISLTISADYRRDKKRTKLSFEFVEANASMAPYSVVNGLGAIFGAGNESIFAAQQGVWGMSPPPADAMTLLRQFSQDLHNTFGIATDPDSLDALDMLHRWIAPASAIVQQAQAFLGRMEAPVKTPSLLPGMEYPVTLKYATDPIDYASASIRRIHFDALERLREFNFLVVQRSERLRMPSPSAQSLIITTRLIVIRDYAIAAAQKVYPTIKAALDDLDFIISVYDDEEATATQRCDDVLVAAIRKARATATSAILGRNIRAPGIGEFPTDGQWPSLVVAQKLYNDGARYQEVENYNPHMTPLWMGGPPGGGVIAPTR